MNKLNKAQRFVLIYAIVTMLLIIITATLMHLHQIGDVQLFLIFALIAWAGQMWAGWLIAA